MLVGASDEIACPGVTSFFNIFQYACDKMVWLCTSNAPQVSNCHSGRIKFVSCFLSSCRRPTCNIVLYSNSLLLTDLNDTMFYRNKHIEMQLIVKHFQSTSNMIWLGLFILDSSINRLFLSQIKPPSWRPYLTYNCLLL